MLRRTLSSLAGRAHAARRLSSQAAGAAPAYELHVDLMRFILDRPRVEGVLKDNVPVQAAQSFAPSLVNVPTRDLAFVAQTFMTQANTIEPEQRWRYVALATSLLEVVLGRRDELQDMATFSLAQVYSLGLIDDNEPKRMIDLLQGSAERGHVPSKALLGKLLWEGKDVPRDPRRAEELLEQAIEQNDMHAAAILAEIKLQSGDAQRAFDLFSRAAEADIPEAHLALGVMLSGSKKHAGPVTDLTRAFNHFQKAAELGDMPQAWHNMGTCYFAGKGVAADMKEAAECFRKGAEGGWEYSQVNLGHMYMNGMGVERDLLKAKHYLSMAAPTNALAKGSLENVEKMLAEQSQNK